MTTVNIHEAKTNLSKLLKIIEDGGEVVIAKAGQPIAELKRYQPPTNGIKFGLAKGQIKYHEDIIGPDPDIIALFNKSRVTPHDH